MEKLIELLNEFGRERQTQLNRPIFIKDRDNQSILISKQFGFIQRLVENDKINLDKAYLENCCMCGGFIRYGEVNGLIMKLSISSSPIEDLIRYLK